MYSLSAKPTLRHNITKRRSFKVKCSSTPPTPTSIKDRVRLFEVAAGRSAMAGLLIGTLITDFAGVPFSIQLAHELPVVATITAAISAITIIPNIHTGLKRHQVTHELNMDRFSMVAMTILFLVEKIPM